MQAYNRIKLNSHLFRGTGKIAGLASALALIISTVSTPAQAAFLSFEDRTTWHNLVGTPTLTEDFSKFTQDTEFRTHPLALKGMTVTGGTAYNGSITNLIDVFPYSDTGVDGTNYLYGEIQQNDSNGPKVDMRIDFEKPVTAWGTDLKASPGGSGFAIYIFDSQDKLLGTIDPSPPFIPYPSFFRGFVLDNGETASYLIFSDIQDNYFNQLFRIDNIALVQSKESLESVPEPSSTLGIITVSTLVLASTLKRKLKSSKPTEKELEKVT